MADSSVLQLLQSWDAPRNSEKTWERASAPGPLQAEGSLIEKVAGMSL